MEDHRDEETAHGKQIKQIYQTKQSTATSGHFGAIWDKQVTNLKQNLS